ncbi:hypothetical protein D3C76_1495550 [compost metagenome]
MQAIGVSVEGAGVKIYLLGLNETLPLSERRVDTQNGQLRCQVGNPRCRVVVAPSVVMIKIDGRVLLLIKLVDVAAHAARQPIIAVLGAAGLSHRHVVAGIGMGR